MVDTAARRGKISSKSQWDGLQHELLTMLPPGQHLGLESVHAPIGHVYSLSVRDDEFPGSNIIAVTDEQLLAKLRSVKGQFVHGGLRIFYHEYCPLRRGGDTRPAQV